MNLNRILFGAGLFINVLLWLLINKSKMSCKTLDLTDRPDVRVELLNYSVNMC